MTLRNSIFIPLFLVLFFEGWTQEGISIRKYSLEDGLPDREITSVVQDSTGFLWVGTSRGISRFDGYNFVNFNSTNIDGFSDNKINTLLVVGKKLWIGTQSNLLLFDLENYRIENFGNFEAIERLFLDTSKSVWVVTVEGQVFRVNDQQIREVEEVQPVPTWIKSNVNQVTTIGEGLSGVWWGRLDGVLKQYDTDTESVNVVFKGDKYEQKGSVFLQNDSSIWHSTNTYLKLFDLEGTELKLVSDQVETSRHLATVQLPNGSLAMVNQDGKILMLDASNLSHHLDVELSNLFPEPGMLRSVLYTDKHFWFATSSGLFQIRRDVEKFEKVLAGQPKKVSVRSFLEFENGTLMVSTYEGLYLLDEEENVVKEIKDPYLIFYDFIKKSENNYWAASEGQGLIEIETVPWKMTNLTFSHSAGGNNARYTTSLEEHDSILFIGAYRGLFQYNKQTDEMSDVVDSTGKSLLIGTRVNDLYIDFRRTLWVAANNGIFTINLNEENLKKKMFEKFSDGNFEARVIHATADQVMWFGTKEFGLLEYDSKKDTVSQWLPEDGLANEAVSSIVTSNNEQFLWLGTDNGLSHFDRVTKSFVNYFEVDGISNNEFNKNAAFRNSEGTIYMGGIDGVNVFDPYKLTKEKRQPKMLLTSFSKYDGNERKVISKNRSIIHQRRFKILPNDRFFSFQFALAHFDDVAKNKYRYRIEEIHDDWVDLGTQHELLIDNLDPGDYSIRIQGSSGDGYWSAEELKLDLTIAQVFYKTWWFFSLCTLIALSLGWMWHKMKVRQLLKLERVRTRIARDLHDELGSSLTRISMYSEIAKENSDSADTLDEVASMSRDAASTLSDIVWSIDNTDDSLGALLERIKDHLHLMVEPVSLQTQFSAMEIDESIQLKAEVKQNIYLIAKEAINNSIKYSNGSCLSIVVAIEESDLKMNIFDDGSGALKGEDQISKGGNGIRNMDSRAKTVGGKLEIRNENGFAVLLSIPL